jgi:hypothetical protein
MGHNPGPKVQGSNWDEIQARAGGSVEWRYGERPTLHPIHDDLLADSSEPNLRIGRMRNDRRLSARRTRNADCAYRESHLWTEAVAHKAANQNVRTHASPRNNREAREIRSAIGEQEEHFAVGQRESAQLSWG